MPLSSAPSPVEGSLNENNGNRILLPLPPGRAGPTSYLPHGKQCFLVLTVGYPQGRMALGAPQGCRALWLRADDNWGWNRERLGVADLRKIPPGFPVAISALSPDSFWGLCGEALGHQGPRLTSGADHLGRFGEQRDSANNPSRAL